MITVRWGRVVVSVLLLAATGAISVAAIVTLIVRWALGRGLVARASALTAAVVVGFCGVAVWLPATIDLAVAYAGEGGYVVSFAWPFGVVLLYLVPVVVAVVLGWWRGGTILAAWGWPRLLVCAAAALLVHVLAWYAVLALRAGQVADARAEAFAHLVAVGPPEWMETENAAELYEELLRHWPWVQGLAREEAIYRAQSALWNVTLRSVLEDRAEELRTALQDEALREALERQEPYLEQLGHIAREPLAVWVIWEDRSPIPHCDTASIPFLQAVELVCIRACYHAINGNIDAALKDIELLARLRNQHFGGEFEAVRSADYIDVSLCSALQFLLAHQRLDHRALARLERVTAPRRVRSLLAISMRREYARALLALCTLAEGSTVGAIPWIRGSIYRRGEGVREWRPLLWRVAAFGSELVACRRTYREALRWALAAERAAPSQPTANTTDPAHGGNLIARRYADELAIWRTRRVVWQTTIALCRYLLDTGSAPDDLAELVPRYLPYVPTDPWVDRPLGYLQTEEFVIVYSVLRDGERDFLRAGFGGIDFGYAVPLAVWLDRDTEPAGGAGAGHQGGHQDRSRSQGHGQAEKRKR